MPLDSPAPKRLPIDNRGRRVSPPQNPVSNGGLDSGNLPVTSPQGLNEELHDNAAGAAEFDRQKFVLVKLSDIRKEVECPICLGIIRKTRTVMECMHRFCKECIDKSMRLGNNECPACRTHCSSRRSMRDDPNYDALIATLYPNVDLYKEEEFTWREEEREKNKKIQTSIAGTYQRQSEAVGKKRSLAKENQSSNRIVTSSDEDFHPHLNFSTDSSSPDLPHKRNRRSRLEIPPDLVDSSSSASSEDLAWRNSGARSRIRRGSATAKPNSSRVTRIVDLLRASAENRDELDVHLTLLPEKGTDLPSLPRPHLRCRSTVSIQHIRRFVALHAPIHNGDLEILVDSPDESGNRKEQRFARAEETLAGLVSGPNLVLVYRLKSG